MMSKIGESLLRGAAQALAHARGEKTAAKVHKVVVRKHIDVKAIRKKLQLSRGEFATRYGFSVRTLEKWEQGTREPRGTTRSYLIVIDQDPKAVEVALKKGSADLKK
jgi:putative transcriptional regulator